jgi:type II secretory pathway pseudopilin PulG
VIAVLAGLLLIVLSKAKAQAQEIACLNNMMQLQLARILYAGDSDERIPPDYPNQAAGNFPYSAGRVSG